MVFLARGILNLFHQMKFFTVLNMVCFLKPLSNISSANIPLHLFFVFLELHFLVVSSNIIFKLNIMSLRKVDLHHFQSNHICNFINYINLYWQNDENFKGFFSGTVYYKKIIPDCIHFYLAFSQKWTPLSKKTVQY